MPTYRFLFTQTFMVLVRIAILASQNGNNKKLPWLAILAISQILQILEPLTFGTTSIEHCIVSKNGFASKTFF